MSGDWYYRILGEEFGPASFEMIGELARDGTISPEHELRCTLDGEWMPAGAVAGLFPEPEELNDLSELDFEFADSGESELSKVHDPQTVAARTTTTSDDTDFELTVSAIPPAESGIPVGEPKNPDLQMDAAEQSLTETAETTQYVEDSSVKEPQGTANRNRSDGADRRRKRRAGGKKRPRRGKRSSDDVIAQWLSEEVAESPGRSSDECTPESTTANAVAVPGAVHSAASESAPAPSPTPPPEWPTPSQPRPTSRPRESVAGLAALASAASSSSRGSSSSFDVVGRVVRWLAGNLTLVVPVLVVALGIAWFLYPRANSNQFHYEAFNAIYNDFKYLRSRNAGEAEWDQFEQEVDQQLASITAQLEQDVDSSRGKTQEGQQHLLNLASDIIPRLLEESRHGMSEADSEFQEEMKSAVAAFDYFR